MLILTRRPDESLVMTTPKGEQVEVIVLGVKGNQVRLGIVADKSINIVRSELLDDEVA
jgi:carbon storage regulator